MALSINTNIAAMNAYRNLSSTQNDLSSSLEKLSSGFRINRAADDAAGLAISEGLRSQIGGLQVAVRNAQDGISVVQTAEGALTETHAILQRMRDLSVQGSNTGGLTDEAKDNLQKELSELKSELNRIADTTTFNGTQLLDGSYDGKFQVGANVGESISVNIGTAMSAEGLGVKGVDITITDGRITAGTPVAADYDTGTSTGTAASIAIAAGDVELTLSEGFDQLNGTVSYGEKSLDLSTVNYDEGTTAAERLTTLESAITAALGDDVTVATPTAGNGLTLETAAPTDADDVANFEDFAFAQASGADLAIDAIDEAINTVSTTRADLGAKQNRLDHTINSLNVAVENLSASESRIRDTDMASEMVNFTRAQILSQAGTAMLAQANQIPQGVLQLLQ